MKTKTILISIIILALVLMLPMAAFAQTNTQYHYIIEDAQMTLTGNIKGTITIPGTWYVQYVSDASAEQKNVTYYNNKISGVVNAGHLSTKTTDTPQGDTYFRYTGVLTEKLGMPLVLYTDTSDMSSVQILKDYENIEFLAFGAGNQKEYMLVNVSAESGGNFIGFVQTNQINQEPLINVVKSQLSKNPDLNTGDDLINPPVNDNPKETPTNNVLKIVLITAVAILSVVVLCLIFKPAKRSKPDDKYYEQE